MLKQYKILINEGKGPDNVLANVPAGAGARGNPTRIVAKPNTRYELQDDSKGKGLAPDQVRGKRVGKNLHLMFENSAKPDVIIDGYYEPANQTQAPSIVGKAENGSFYEYIPHDPELTHMSSTLKEGNTPTMLSLGGGPIAVAAFELAALPVVAAAAASGGLGGLGWVAAGLGAAALAGGGGGGGGVKDTQPPSKPTSLVIPESTNGGVNADEAKDGTPLEVGLPADAVAGDVLKTVLTKPDGTKITLDPITLTAAMIAAKTLTQTIPAGVLKGDGVWTTSSTLTDAAGNVGAPIDGTFTLDTIAPTPVVKIETDSDAANDGNGDGTITTAEIGLATNVPPTTVSVSATFADKANLKVGDKLKFTDAVSGAMQEVTLDLAMVNSGKVTTNFARPSDGASLNVSAVLTDTAQNVSVTSNMDAAKMGDTTPPKALGNGLDCHLKHDALNDTGASQTDSITQAKTPVLVGQVEANADVSVLVNGVAYTTKARADGTYEISVTNALDDGPYTPVVTATDAFGNSTTVNGTPFYVDNKSDVNQSPTKNLPDSNTSATVDIASISDDTRNSMDMDSTTSDFVTRDNTLIYTGKVATFDNNGDYVKLELKNSKGEVVATDYLKPDNLAWTWDRTSVTQADGKYTLEASVVDAAGNRVNTKAAGIDTQTIYISNQSLQAVADNDQDLAKSPGLVKAVEAGFNVAGSAGTGNVLANDKNDVLGYEGAQSHKTVKLIDSATKNLVGSLVGQYGTLTLQSNGDYSYTPDNAKQVVDSLRAGKMLSETFNYEVTDATGATGATSQSTLSVSVVGSNDQATLTFASAKPFALNWYDQPFKIFVIDHDANEGSFIQPNDLDLQGAFGSFKVSNMSNEWSYRAKDSYTPFAGKTVHDLLVLTTSDGAATGVIDVQLDGTDTITQQEFNVKTTNGLTIDGGKTFDVLKINGQNQTLDLTKMYGGLTSQINSIEEIDLGTGSNTLVINLDDLMQADGNRLFVEGSSNSQVTFVNGTGHGVQTSGTYTTSHEGKTYTYAIYQIQSNDLKSYDLLVENTITQISFSAT